MHMVMIALRKLCANRLLLATCALCMLAAIAGCRRNPYRTMPADELLKRAAAELTTFNFELSATMYQSLLDKLPTDDAHRPEALFGLALSLQNATPATPDAIARSQKTYEQLIAESPNSPYTPRATLQIGRLAEVPDYMEDPADLPAARKQYQQVIDQWPDQPIADEAALRLGGSCIAVYDDKASIEQGVRIIRDWLKQRPDNPMASVMWEYLAQTYDIHLKDEAEALNAYLEADRIGLVNQAVAGQTWWHMAELAEHQGRLDVAVSYHQKIITQAPKSGRAWESQQALKRISAAHPQMRITIPPMRLFSRNPVADQESEAAP